jgi:hypothetical protein
LLRQAQPFTECFKLFSGHFAAQIQGGQLRRELSVQFIFGDYFRTVVAVIFPFLAPIFFPLDGFLFFYPQQLENLADPEAVFFFGR